ncbi:MAG: hypothetical protein JXA30_00885 [Deltaproteobacteria bacterium]|nr:hypothetical protein [Deltaproteobacteria bacterium]
MSAKVNVVLDDDVKEQMDELVPSGRRSRLINQALRRELLRIRREGAVREIERLRKQTRRVTTDEIVQTLAKDRNRS